MSDLGKRLHIALNRLTKWRWVFAMWQTGSDDLSAENMAIRDHRELSIMLRAECSALLKILLDKGIVTQEEHAQVLLEEADFLSKSYEKKFPGFKAVDEGLDINTAIARDTMAEWGKKP